MDKVKRLTLEVRVNRIIIGSMLVLFSINTSVSPLGGIALVPLIGAILVLSGILDWKSLPELIESLKLRERFKGIFARHHKSLPKARLVKIS